MGDIVSYFSTVAQTAGQTQTISNITSFADFTKGLEAAGISTYGASVGKAVSGLSAAEAESAMAAYATSPVHLAIEETAAGTGIYEVTATTGKVVQFTGAASSGEMVTGATISMPKTAVIMAVAAAMGYAIGWDLAGQIDEWLGNRNFDWGKDSIGGKIITYVTGGAPDNSTFYSYVAEDLVQRLGQALGLWGINNHMTVAPEDILPDTEHAVSYDLAGRFPNAPEKYVMRAQKLINKFDIPTANNYISLGVAPDDNLLMTVFNTNNFSVLYRDPLSNTGRVMLKGTTRLRVRRGAEDLSFAQWEIHSDGAMVEVTPWTEIFIGSHDFVLGAPGCVWDNFGQHYWTIDDGKIGSQTNDIINIIDDPNKQNIEFPINIPVEFPDWWSHRIEVPAPDISPWENPSFDPNKIAPQKPYLPIKWPYKTPNPQPYPTPDPDPDPDPEKVTPPQGDDVRDPQPDPPDVFIPWDWDWPDPDPDPDPEKDTPDPQDEEPDPDDKKPDPPEPPTPTPTIPTLPTSSGVSDTGMVALYNPSKSQLRAFSAWLWSLTEDIIKKLFQDPMQAVIGLHMIYASPDVLGSGTIVVGNIDTEKPSNYIDQYTTINCGTLKINPFWNNVHDYIGTSIQIYLPFIGIVDLNTADVMGKYVQVIYKIDWLSGACLAYINLKKEGGSFYTAYTFSGNCSVEFPLTGANYSSLIASGIMAVGSVAAAAITKNPSAIVGAVGGGAAGVAGSNVNITRSGNISGNAGAMGIKKPYLIINRNYPVDATQRQHYEGFPQRQTVKLSNQSGYTRVYKIDLKGLSCTEIEKEMILEKLKEGVYI